MRKPGKIGLLILLLAIPIFFVLFFELFSTSHYTVPVFYEDGIDSLSQCESSYETHRVGSLQAYNVADQESQPIEFSGITRVVFVLPAECQENCTILFEELARVQGVLEAQFPLQIVLLGSSNSNVQQLAEKYGLSQPKWLFLEGTEAQYSSFLQCELVLPRAEIPQHETLVLLDEQGRIRGYYGGVDAAEVDRLIAEIRILQYSLENDPHAEDRPG